MLDDCFIATNGTIDIMNAIEKGSCRIKRLSLESNNIGRAAQVFIDRALGPNKSFSINLEENSISAVGTVIKKKFVSKHN